MRFGILEDDWNVIRNIFEKSSKVEKLILFGSRAKGTHKNESDIDLVVFGEQITYKDYLQLYLQLDDIGMLHKIDLINFNTITSKELQDHIKRVGIIIYKKPSNN